MKTDIKIDGDTIIMTIDGDIDYFTVPGLKESIRQALEQGQRNILIDLANVSYLDSSAIGLFINTHKDIQSRGFKVSLVNPKRETMQLLKLTYVDQMLDIFSSYSEIEKKGK